MTSDVEEKRERYAKQPFSYSIHSVVSKIYRVTVSTGQHLMPVVKATASPVAEEMLSITNHTKVQPLHKFNFGRKALKYWKISRKE